MPSTTRLTPKGEVDANEEEAMAALMELQRALRHGEYRYENCFPK